MVKSIVVFAVFFRMGMRCYVLNAFGPLTTTPILVRVFPANDLRLLLFLFQGAMVKAAIAHHVYRRLLCVTLSFTSAKKVLQK
jgi:hypothetical protein